MIEIFHWKTATTERIIMDTLITAILGAIIAAFFLAPELFSGLGL